MSKRKHILRAFGQENLVFKKRFLGIFLCVWLTAHSQASSMIPVYSHTLLVDEHIYRIDYAMMGHPDISYEWYGEIALYKNDQELYRETGMQLSLSGVCRSEKQNLPVFVFSYGFYRLDGTVQSAIVDDGDAVRRMDIIDWQALNDPQDTDSSDAVDVIQEKTLPLTALGAETGQSRTSQFNSFARCNIHQWYGDQLLLDKWQVYLNEISLIKQQILLTTDSGQKRLFEIARLTADGAKVNDLLTRTLDTLHYADNRVFANGEDRFVSLKRQGNPYNAFSYVLWRHKGNWYLFERGGQSSKGVNEITGLEQMTNGQLRFDLCIEDCSWWGEYETIKFDWQLELVRD
ncbi:hypothetical protein [Planctobacterium marinum]|uniref:Uncharacterized protein n=1 Tax=Planctobacterium marinum TaxID=1631968 RepID=A0AA48HF90_9ALTE|nr:hypothetical protein MACH26_13940 [Planctobacterium marinum]